MPADFGPSNRSVLDIAADLASGRTSGRELIEAALAQIADPAGEGARTFVKVYDDRARAAADAQDRLRRAGYVASPLAGLPVSIKDLFDVAGDMTLAGSKALDDRPAAERDAPVVARLRAAGAVLVGRTNMTEFAFSGVGINPHYGTPGNPYDRSLIPGGSSSGAAVSVADGQAVVGIGSDTGGSVRIPAALCGLAVSSRRRTVSRGMESCRCPQHWIRSAPLLLALRAAPSSMRSWRASRLPYPRLSPLRRCASVCRRPMFWMGSRP